MGGNKCHTCGQSVPKKERVYAVGVIFHSACLKCNECGKSFAYSETPSEFNAKPVCKSCFDCLIKGRKPKLDTSGAVFPSQNKHLFGGDSKFATAGGVALHRDDAFNRQDIKPTTAKPAQGAGTPCSKCKKKMEMGSIVSTRDGKKFHINCFRCNRCDAILSKSDYSTRNGKYFCGNNCDADRAITPAGYNTNQMGKNVKLKDKEYLSEKEKKNVRDSSEVAPSWTKKADTTEVTLRSTSNYGGNSGSNSFVKKSSASLDEEKPAWATAEDSLPTNVSKVTGTKVVQNEKTLWGKTGDSSVEGNRDPSASSSPGGSSSFRGIQSTVNSSFKSPQSFDKPVNVADTAPAASLLKSGSGSGVGYRGIQSANVTASSYKAPPSFDKPVSSSDNNNQPPAASLLNAASGTAFRGIQSVGVAPSSYKAPPSFDKPQSSDAASAHPPAASLLKSGSGSGVGYRGIQSANVTSSSYKAPPSFDKPQNAKGGGGGGGGGSYLNKQTYIRHGSSKPSNSNPTQRRFDRPM